ncbi:uncharacterized protein BDW43DRAFT_296878 [Aspergillus alliaceus]|uniref:uncharacterized protein n=1 Tax=Petromyces alliaceus TaxID=209559 RepID=UPI0012A70B8F|nr:uncharacterized protein BDW43DRAFT_296878 [Aspergillus alliaceus]KAB8238719.1 hypothetical protein BDW43DRAFT_296878 [Aspergillus alliaceus]
MLILEKHAIKQTLLSLSSQECHPLLASLHTMLHKYCSTNDVSQRKTESIISPTGQTALIMPCSTPESTSVKIVTVGEGVEGCISLLTLNGGLIGLLDAKELTGFRISLAIIILFLRFPYSNSSIVVFAAGRQAEWHIRLALPLCDDVKGLGQLFDLLGRSHPELKFERLRVRLAVADAIFCCTPTTTPHFPHEYLSKVDSKYACLAEAGEMIQARVKRDQLIEAGALYQGDDIQLHHGNHVFKCVGLAIMDLAVTQKILSMAKKGPSHFFLSPKAEPYPMDLRWNRRMSLIDESSCRSGPRGVRGERLKEAGRSKLASREVAKE